MTINGSGFALAMRTAASGAGGGGAAAATTPDDSLFNFLWRDLNAATAALLPTGANWAQAATATVANAMQLLYDKLTVGEVLMERGVSEGGAAAPAPPAPREAGIGPPAGDPELVLRGLRVRVGLHSGPEEDEVELQQLAGGLAARYCGCFLSTCKEVSDAAVGGMIILSGPTFRAYQQSRQRAKPLEVMLLHVGDHVVQAGNPDLEGATTQTLTHHATVTSPPAAITSAIATATGELTRELFAAVSPTLVPRLALLPSPVRTAREVVPGCLSAPAGMVAPVFCNVLGVESLLAWERAVQERYLRAHSTGLGDPSLRVPRPSMGGGPRPSAGGVPRSSVGHGGPSLSQGLRSGLLAAQDTAMNGLGGGAGVDGVGVVPRPGTVQAALELLRDAVTDIASRHGGYVVASSADGGHWVLVFGSAEAAVLWGLEMLEAMLAAAWPEGLLEHELTEEVWEGGVLLKRGLRLRIGIDYGQAMVRLVPRTGRLDYVGRPMNRAARIAAKAKAASVLASDAVWSTARGALGTLVTPTSLGLGRLKGVKEAVELWALRVRPQAVPP
ncbi:hypothetical protein GPECTOR_6g725 [Gonium pectorale]|uniref:Guanylate cyclase domain-containing protein n=1 Tax=Gonium pectorale TaxID=33097 RepID=A0A150GV99_GONPE|nr:hypothetical protein GPECTOR_6g725 [Gonium pectorale]|eukprot:KXZ53807.1 hypothetical protein GPECTOR_6g725 [Gonium pectorale]